jgi:AcrR family transcriptional regulator
MSPRSKAQFEEIRQKSMQSIKEAALELFGRSGYHSTSISQIAKAAGISKGLLYNYFENKEALLEAIIMEAVEMGEAMMEEMKNRPGSAAEKLEQLTEASFMIVQQDPHYWKLMTALAFQTDALKSLQPILKKKQELAIDMMVTIFTELGSKHPREEALFYGAVMDGVMLHYMQMDDYPVEQMKKYVLNKFLNR